MSQAWSKFPARRFGRLWPVWILLLSAPAGGQTAPGPGAEASAAPSSVEAASSRVDTAAASRAMGTLETIEQRLQLTDAEAGAYRLARARKGQVDDPVALTLFLRKLRNLPDLPPAEMNHLDQPAVRNLLAHPERYAGHPIRLRVRVNCVWTRQPGVDFGETPDWRRGDGPIYRYDCLNAEDNSSAGEPVYVLSPLEPNRILGRPRKDGNQGERIYDIPPVQIAGVFFKVFADQDRDGRAMEYPVVLAWQMRPAAGAAWKVAPESWTQALGIAIVLFLGIAGYFFWRLRMSARNLRKGPRPPPPRAADARRQEEVPDEEEPADADLAAAAEEFRKKNRPPQ